MKRIVFKDMLKRNKYLQAETWIRFLKSFIKEVKFDNIQKTKAAFILHKKCKNFSKIKTNNWCILSGWSHSVLWDFRVSRMKLKELASEGVFPGVKRWNF